MTTRKIIHFFIYAALPALLLAGCKKWIGIDPPVDTVTTPQMFASNKEAERAMAAVYSKLINGNTPYNIVYAAETNFGSGLPTVLGGLSSDELVVDPSSRYGDLVYLSSNMLTLKTSTITVPLWNTAYKAIFDANGVLEGITESKSALLTDSARKQLTGEALSIRAFAYFYLVNFFGDLPLALTVDFNQTAGLARSPVNTVYQQITTDLKQARTLLGNDYSVGNGERVRINKWFAEALLARVSLYAGDYQQAITSATAVINEKSLFGLEEDPDAVFLKNSRETILQFKQTSISQELKNATPEGIILGPILANLSPKYYLSATWPDLFEQTDKRKSAWIMYKNGVPCAWKYKINNINSVYMGDQTQYYTVMRLAEMYLVRAEANVLMPGGNTENAINDLNEIRRRANVDELAKTLTAPQVIDAVAKERQRELFAEWGHRWLDLKRTGKASSVLSAIPSKQPWRGDFQLLYPIPENEILANNKLVQNPKYNIQ